MVTAAFSRWMRFQPKQPEVYYVRLLTSSGRSMSDNFNDDDDGDDES